MFLSDLRSVHSESCVSPRQRSRRWAPSTQRIHRSRNAKKARTPTFSVEDEYSLRTPRVQLLRRGRVCREPLRDVLQSLSAVFGELVEDLVELSLVDLQRFVRRAQLS